MPPKRTNANVSRRSGDNGGGGETIIIGEDNDSFASSENGNDHILDDGNDISGVDEDSAGDEENASPNKSVARPRAATRKKAVVKKKSRATSNDEFYEQFMDDPDKVKTERETQPKGHSLHARSNNQLQVGSIGDPIRRLVLRRY